MRGRLLVVGLVLAGLLLALAAWWVRRGDGAVRAGPAEGPVPSRSALLLAAPSAVRGRVDTGAVGRLLYRSGSRAVTDHERARVDDLRAGPLATDRAGAAGPARPAGA
jgi:hypothetical protein